MRLTAFSQKLAALAELSPAEKAAVEQLPLVCTTVKRRRDILKAGETPDQLYVLLEGWAARYALRRDGTRRITGFLLPGDFCGIHAICHAAMDHSVIALTECKVGWIKAQALRRLVAESPALNDALWRAKLNEEAILRRWLLVSDGAQHAVAHLLCELYSRAEQIGLTQQGKLDLPITQEEMGDALGLTGVHVNRTLRDLRDRGAISLANKVLRIEDPAAMRSLAEFDGSYLTSWAASVH